MEDSEWWCIWPLGFWIPVVMLYLFSCLATRAALNQMFSGWKRSNGDSIRDTNYWEAHEQILVHARRLLHGDNCRRLIRPPVSQSQSREVAGQRGERCPTRRNEDKCLLVRPRCRAFCFRWTFPLNIRNRKCYYNNAVTSVPVSFAVCVLFSKRWFPSSSCLTLSLRSSGWKMRRMPGSPTTALHSAALWRHHSLLPILHRSLAALLAVASVSPDRF